MADIATPDHAINNIIARFVFVVIFDFKPVSVQLTGSERFIKEKSFSVFTHLRHQNVKQLK